MCHTMVRSPATNCPGVVPNGTIHSLGLDQQLIVISTSYGPYSHLLDLPCVKETE